MQCNIVPAMPKQHQHYHDWLVDDTQDKSVASLQPTMEIPTAFAWRSSYWLRQLKGLHSFRANSSNHVTFNDRLSLSENC